MEVYYTKEQKMINAYKIEKIKQIPTFNVWHDQLLIQLIIETTNLDKITKNGEGIIKLTKEDIEMIKTGLTAKQGEVDEAEWEYTQKKIKRIEKDLGDAEEVKYICER